MSSLISIVSAGISLVFIVELSMVKYFWLSQPIINFFFSSIFLLTFWVNCFICGFAVKAGTISNPWINNPLNFSKAILRWFLNSFWLIVSFRTNLLSFYWAKWGLLLLSSVSCRLLFCYWKTKTWMPRPRSLYPL